MRASAARAALFGVVSALLVAAVFVGLLVTGVLPQLLGENAPDSILVIVAAPDGEGAMVASFGFVLDSALNRPLIVDMLKQGTIEGTSARTPRAALPFGGGAVVSQSLAPQTGEALEWVIIRPAAWSSMVDREGGVEIAVPTDISTYRDGELTVLQAGQTRLSGDEVVALAAALDFMSEEDARAVSTELSRDLGGVIFRSAESLNGLVADEQSDSSLSSDDIARFIGKTD